MAGLGYILWGVILIIGAIVSGLVAVVMMFGAAMNDVPTVFSWANWYIYGPASLAAVLAIAGIVCISVGLQS